MLQSNFFRAPFANGGAQPAAPRIAIRGRDIIIIDLFYSYRRLILCMTTKLPPLSPSAATRVIVVEWVNPLRLIPRLPNRGPELDFFREDDRIVVLLVAERWTADTLHFACNGNVPS